MADADRDMQKSPSVWVIVVAGGSGSRFGGLKQLSMVGGRSVVRRAVETAAEVCTEVVLVAPDSALESHRAQVDPGVVIVAGGATRAESVRRGLATVPPVADIVLVHDAARPLASSALYRRVIDAVVDGAAAVVPVVPLVDSLREVGGRAVDRDRFRAVQTPQGFRHSVLVEAHSSGAEATDDATLAEACGHEVVVVDGEPDNLKITRPTDLQLADRLVGS